MFANPSQSLRPPPPISGHWLFGNLPEVRRDPLGMFLRGALDHGPIASARFFRQNVCFVGTPAGVEHVLKDHAKAYTKDTPGFDMLRLVFGNGLFVSEGSFWLRQRRIMQPAFHRDVVASFAPFMFEETAALASIWDRAIDVAGGPVRRDVVPDVTRLTLRIVARCLFGSADDGDAAIISRVIPFLLETMTKRIRAIVPPLSIPTPGNRKIVAALAELNAIVDKIVRRRREAAARGEERRDLLALLMETTDADTGERMTDAQLRDEILTLYLAGHETTALGIAWGLSLLSRAPKVAADVAREADAALPSDRPADASDADKLALATRVFKETLRIYPPVYNFGRRAAEDLEIEGFLVPKGWLVFVSPYAIHRHPDAWPNPEGFDPDRFLPAAEKARSRYAYLPFGAGPRICIGQGFAMLEGAIALAALTARFSIDLAPGEIPTPEPLITLRPSGGLRMTISRRRAS